MCVVLFGDGGVELDSVAQIASGSSLKNWRQLVGYFGIGVLGNGAIAGNLNL